MTPSLRPKSSTKLVIAAITLGTGIMAASLFGPLNQLYAANSMPSLPSSYITDNDPIRVGLTKAGAMEWFYNSAELSSTEGLVINGGAARPLMQLNPAQSVTVKRTPDGSGFIFQAKESAMAPLTIYPPFKIESTTPTGLLVLADTTKKSKKPQYRGYFELLASPKDKVNFTVVDILPLGYYLQGVVPNEMPPSFGDEASKTQAVLARNYAIRPREKPFNGFDICDSPYCQAYYGASTEVEKVNQLIRDTQGLVTLYNGDPILALYSSTHGGVSESYQNVFKPESTSTFTDPVLPYLAARSDKPITVDLTQEQPCRDFYTTKPDSYDINSPLYRWERTYTQEQLLKIIPTKLQTFIGSALATPEPETASPTNITSIQEFQVLKRGTSGKVLTLKIITNAGNWVINGEGNIRRFFEGAGQNALPSANIVITHSGNPATKQLTSITINGGGFGHGVGLSQYGAGFLSKQGLLYPQIIKHYYRGVQLGTIPLVINAQRPNQQLLFANPQANKAVLKVKTNGGSSTVVVDLNGKNIPLGHLYDKPASLPIDLKLLKPQNNMLVATLPTTTGNVTATVWLEFE